MPEDFAELIRASFDAVARGDTDFLVASSDPEIEIVEPTRLLGATTYRGHAGLRAALDNWAGQWDDFGVDIERMIPAGAERVIVVARHHGRGKASGAEVELRNVNVYEGRDGRVVRWEIFSSLDEAFAAIGLRRLQRGR